MKLSAETLAVLKNFATINRSLHIKPGNKLITAVEASMAVLAYCEVPETFEHDIRLYDLAVFLNVWQMFTEPELKVLSASTAEITEGRNLIKFQFANPETMNKVRDPSKFAPQETVAELKISREEFVALMKAAAILQLPTIAIRGKNGKLTVEAVNIENSSQNSYELQVGTTDRTFAAYYSMDLFRQMPGAYKVKVTTVCAHFHAVDDKLPKTLQYWIAGKQESTF